MLRDLHSEKGRSDGVYSMNSEEMLGEIDIANSMNFYPYFNEEVKMCS